jgi:hypothetical protein
LCGQLQRIANSDANRPVTNVESHNPHIFMIPTRTYTGL